ncbi:ABC transporter substrate-binding protein [Pusillimonas noertemannii]|uniref:ABC transporter substrate-binding protein n=1 Tax=Pusillimonas noertemannii TaxID=305977 RepID=UPI0002D4B4E9|nr:ABC transporter substrate-binding protein [Pusillimonas noertemannii]
MNWMKAIGCCMAFAASTAAAQVKVGATIPLTGPVAMLGLGQEKAMQMYDRQVGDLSIQYITLDDASDTTAAVNNVKKLSKEHAVDVIIGSSSTPQCLAMLDAIAQAEVPTICLGSASAVVTPMDDKRKWVFKIPPNDEVWIEGMAKHMQASGVKKLGFIGFNDAFGESWLQAMSKIAGSYGVEIVAAERYGRTDSSVTAQVLKVLMKKPDAVLIAASGTPAALPTMTLRERGFKGKIYLNASIATKEFMETAGPAANGALLSIGVGLVADEVPDSNPLKKLNQEFKQQYEAKFGEGTFNIFAMQGYDAFRILRQALPVAAKTASPGTPEFRRALRDAIENVHDLHGNTGIYTFSPNDHSGLDTRAVVMAEIQDGQLNYVPE